MINRAAYIESNQTYPYKNLAIEEYLLDHVEKNQIILYLWQNRQTIVIGKNQNAWKECKTSELENDGGYLVRRLSGGGAVYHDLGNLNFTFLVTKEDYDLEKQMEVILIALQKLGLNVVKSGRNDITIDGKKFSGNAFFERGGKSYHHGTLMVNVVMEDLQKYLNVDREKLKSKSVDSVRARVANLSEFYPGLTIALLKVKLKEAFSEVYQVKPEVWDTQQLQQEEIKINENRFSSWDFIFGRKIQFQYEVSKRFAWGDICIKMNVDGGKIKDALIYSDAMNQNPIEEISPVIIGLDFNKSHVVSAMDKIQFEGLNEQEMMKDIKELIYSQEF